VTRTIAASAALAIAAAVAPASQSRSVFRSGTDVVTVSVAVKRGNSAVGNLAASDFRLYDNDVAQSIEALTIESVPVDVTLFMDTSGSTSGALDRMQRNVRAMAAMLRPADRFRLLTIGLSVYETLPWQPAHRALALGMKAVPGISLIYDALLAAFAHQPESGRRHLIVALTDGEDCGSVANGSQVLGVGARSEAVLHVIYVSSSGEMGEYAIGAVCSPTNPDGPHVMAKAAEQSGGGIHRSRFGDPAVRTFSEVLDEFRQSYVLRYSPKGVDGRGWHRVRVDVPGRQGLTIRSRNGYFAE
jgi:VWFA-related protein